MDFKVYHIFLEITLIIDLADLRIENREIFVWFIVLSQVILSIDFCYM